MRDALGSDIAALPDVSVVTTSDPRTPPVNVIESVSAESPEAEQREFERLCRECDATLVIAPELDGRLASRCRMAAELSPLSLNCRPETIDLCGDKWLLAKHLCLAGVRTLPTERLPRVQNRCVELPEAWMTEPLVLKPRRGAGSQSTWKCDNQQELARRSSEFRRESAGEEPVWQPYVAGRALSVAALFDLASCQLVELLPVAEQRLSADGRFTYLGGTMPVVDFDQDAVVHLIRETAACIDGLRGYVGFDLILPASEPENPVLVEINPRLTTSYVGYRRLCRGNLATALLGRSGSALTWEAGPVRFAADGSPE